MATDILGKSGREMLEALVEGTASAAAMAALAKGRLREKIPELERALAGRFRAHQRFLVAEQLAHIDFLDAAIERVSGEIAERMRPFEDALERLDAIPGMGRRNAEGIVAEVGVDMSRFPTAGHLSSWAGMCPGNYESAGKRTSGRTRKGNRYLRALLVEAAHAAGHTKESYLGAQYHRLRARRGNKKAAVAVGHSILAIIYHLLKHPESLYRDLGIHYFDQRNRQAAERRLVRRLEALGNKVTLEPVPLAA
ncbi:MAG: IS110 family transposase [SAR202 cluster bacterium]|nr:IS110 family transposase [SAR202 cluster bacterium]